MINDSYRTSSVFRISRDTSNLISGRHSAAVVTSPYMTTEYGNQIYWNENEYDLLKMHKTTI